MTHPKPTPTLKRPSTWALVLAFTLVYVSWGTTYLAIKKGVKDEQLPPALFGGVRVCLAGLFLLGYLAVRGQSVRLPRRDLGLIIACGCLLFVGGNGLITLAEKTVPSGEAAILAATVPLWIGLFGMLWPGGERLTGRGWLGLAVGLGGVLVLLSPQLGDPAEFVRDHGPLLVLASACCWSFASVLMRHRRLSGSHLAGAAYQMAIGGGCLAVLGLLGGEVKELPAEITPGAVGAFFYLLVVGSLVGFVAYNWLLGHVSAAQVGTYAYVNPAIAVLVAWAAGEDMTPWLLAGILIILTGVALVRAGAPQRAVAEEPEPITEEPAHHGGALREADRRLAAGYDKG
jgi:drug/metabolite transporter (DMT)-like permease